MMATDKPSTIPEPSIDRALTLRKMRYWDYLQTAEWRAIRDAKRAEAGWQCELCSQTYRLQVHHLTYKRRGCELMSDLQTLCYRCHRIAHGLQVDPQGVGRPKRRQKCRGCYKWFGGREMRKHRSTCAPLALKKKAKRPRRVKVKPALLLVGRPKVYHECRHCNGSFSARELRQHTSGCKVHRPALVA